MMKRVTGKWMTAAGLLLALMTTAAGNAEKAVKKTVLPIDAVVIVREVTGEVSYAYDSTGWKALEAGKVLRAGATVRTAENSTALLQVANSTSLLRLTSESRLLLTPEPPADELLSARETLRQERSQQERARQRARREVRLAAVAESWAPALVQAAVQIR